MEACRLASFAVSSKKHEAQKEGLMVSGTPMQTRSLDKSIDTCWQQSATVILNWRGKNLGHSDLEDFQRTKQSSELNGKNGPNSEERGN